MAGVTLLTEEEMYQPYEIAQKVNALIELIGRVGLPVRIVSPGEIIQAVLRARGWTQRDLAEILERSERVVSEIVNARREITPEMAGELAVVFGTSAAFWQRLDANYRNLLQEIADDECFHTQ